MCVGPHREVQCSLAASHKLQDDTQTPSCLCSLTHTWRLSGAFLLLLKSMCKGTLMKRRNQILLSPAAWIVGKSVGWSILQIWIFSNSLYAIPLLPKGDKIPTSMLGLSWIATERKTSAMYSNDFLLREPGRGEAIIIIKKDKDTQPLRLIKSSLAFNKQFFEKKLMEKVTSLLLGRARHTALSHSYYKWNKSVAFLFISDALKGCITHWSLHFSFPHLHNVLRNSSWVIEWVIHVEPNLHTPHSKKPGICRLLLAQHKDSCLSQSESALQKGNHEKEEKIQGCLNGVVPSPTGVSNAHVTLKD